MDDFVAQAINIRGTRRYDYRHHYAIYKLLCYEHKIYIDGTIIFLLLVKCYGLTHSIARWQPSGQPNSKQELILLCHKEGALCCDYFVK